MLCANCGKNDARQYTRKAEGKQITVTLCSACYDKLYPEEGDDFFPSFLGDVGAKRACNACGTTLESFKRTGLLGCAYCYTEFRTELVPTVRFIQGTIRHEGKTPSVEAEQNYDAVRALVREQEEVKASLERALQREDYAEADRNKKRLREINRELYGGEGKQWT